MSTDTVAVSPASTTRTRFLMIGATALTYAVALWIVAFNPYCLTLNDRPPMVLPANMPAGAANAVFTVFLVLFGKTPIQCLTRLAVVAILIQIVSVASLDDSEVSVDRCRAYVFWRAIYRFLRDCMPFLRRTDLSAPPSTALTEDERVTVRYYFVKLIWVPVLTGYLYGNLQDLAYRIANFPQQLTYTAVDVMQVYMVAFMSLMVVDVIYFTFCSMVETKRFSPIVTVDPYASGWLVSMACYPPLVTIVGQYMQWVAPNFPDVTSPRTALTYAVLGMILWIGYVIADFSFGLRAGNLTYRGLVDKGAFRVIRHPMYTSKVLAWVLFTIPELDFHFTMGTPFIILHHSVSLPFLSANYGIIWPMIGWGMIYAMRAITEERYLLRYPEYREYCTRVRYRFIPGLL
jgi:protein-S-isoprenylcysteine O-methyltransferase Ste14